MCRGHGLPPVSYDERCAGAEVPQFLNVLYGNTSLKRVEVDDVDLKDSHLPGDRAMGHDRAPLGARWLKQSHFNAARHLEATIFRREKRETFCISSVGPKIGCLSCGIVEWA